MNDQPDVADFVQASRVLRVHTPVGRNALLPERARFSEGVNELFEIEISVRSKKDMQAEDLIGRLVDVELEVAAGEDGDSIYRPFNGLVTELHEGPPVTRGLRSYQLVLRPQLWLLSQRQDSRIWMDKSTLDVLDTLLSEHGLPQADAAGVIKPVPPIHYSVQYGEKDLDYLLRRLEFDGLFWFFSHEKGQHKLHVADHPRGWLEPSAAAQGESRVRLAQGSTDRNHIREWTKRMTYVPGLRTGADWNHMTPRTIPVNATPSLVSLPGNAKREIYEYPAKAATMAEAERTQKLRMQATEADHVRISGRSNVRILEAGRRFVPYEESNPDRKYEEHVIVRATHRVVDRSYETASTEPEYQNAFEAIPSRVPLTPHRTARRPKIEGTQVAIVAGPTGEEIHPNEVGEIKLWFPWDRRAKKDGTDTRWVRVGQSWAGGGWGGQIIPRIGMEVMVAFIDGDPDRPLVTGVVPNPVNSVAYPLPANKTKSVFRTNTHKGTGFNELSFEDEKDREEVYLHAQKDFTVKVQNHKTERVDANQVLSVGGASVTEIHRTDIHNIGQSMTVNVGTGPAGDIARGKLVRDVFGIRPSAYFVTDMLPLMTGIGNYTVNASSAIMLNALGASFNTTAGASFVSVGLDQTHNIGGSVRVAVGEESSEVVAKKKIIEAHEEIHFRCGKSEIVMKPDGTVHIKGTNLIIEEEEKAKITAGRIELN